MAQDSSIQWTDKTWNPLRGCTKVSEGCRNCYAMSVAYRFSGKGLPYEGLAKKGADGRAVWTNKITLLEDALTQPMHWKKPQKIFVNSMSDLFHPDVPFEFIDKVFAVMALCPQHTFQVLTKRPGRMRDFTTYESTPARIATAMFAILKELGIDPKKRVPEMYHSNGMCKSGSDGIEYPLPNAHLGTSVENQATADERLHDLCACPAAVRFVSYEPALGAVDFHQHLWRYGNVEDAPGWLLNDTGGAGDFMQPDTRLDWIIVGGESGKDARPFNVAWAYDTLYQCKRAGVACFVKQFGAKPYYKEAPLVLKDKHGADWDEWPHDLRVRQFPNA